MLASTSVVHWRGLKSCEITPTAFVVWLPPCTGGNKAHGVLARSLIVKTAGSIRERLAGRHVGDPDAPGQDVISVRSEAEKRDFVSNGYFLSEAYKYNPQPAK